VGWTAPALVIVGRALPRTIVVLKWDLARGRDCDNMGRWQWDALRSVTATGVRQVTDSGINQQSHLVTLSFAKTKV